MHSLALTTHYLPVVARIDLSLMNLHPSQWEIAISVYILPLAVAGAAITFIVWRPPTKLGNCFMAYW